MPSTETCAYCGIAIEGWYDPVLPNSCWKRECRNKEARDLRQMEDQEL